MKRAFKLWFADNGQYAEGARYVVMIVDAKTDEQVATVTGERTGVIEAAAYERVMRLGGVVVA